MKLPAVALAASFAGGILLGLQPVAARHATSRNFLALLFVFLLVCLLAAIPLSGRGKLWPSASCSLAAWVALGIFAACVAQQPLPPEHVLRRMAAGQISGKAPLRYVGRLRNEISRLPWGYGLELDLPRVETAAGALPLRGGMRVGFTPKVGEPSLADSMLEMRSQCSPRRGCRLYIRVRARSTDANSWRSKTSTCRRLFAQARSFRKFERPRLRWRRAWRAGAAIRATNWTLSFLLRRR